MELFPFTSGRVRPLRCHFLSKYMFFQRLCEAQKMTLKLSQVREYLSSVAETVQESSTHDYLIPVKFQRQSSNIPRLMIILDSFFYLASKIIAFFLEILNFFYLIIAGTFWAHIWQLCSTHEYFLGAKYQRHSSPHCWVMTINISRKYIFPSLEWRIWSSKFKLS